VTKASGRGSSRAGEDLEDVTVPEEDEAGGGPRVNPVTGEINGPKGPEPTRYGDWDVKGRCSDF
jgi:hypothetical protein